MIESTTICLYIVMWLSTHGHLKITTITMADIRGSGAACDDRCGCPSPCPGGIACRCTGEDPNTMEHKQCSCGEHCGCNPCTCSKGGDTAAGGTGKAFCRCGAGCACPTCAAVA